MSEGIRQRDFAADPYEEKLRESFRKKQENAATVSENSEEGKGFFTDLGTQVAGGIEDAIKNTVNGFVALGDEWQSSMGEIEKDLELAPGTLATGQAFEGFDDSRIFEKTSREGVSGGVLNATRELTKFLAPFGAASKAMKVAGVNSTAVNLGTSAATTGFFALDPAEDNLANLVQSFPALQNPVTEFLSSDGSDTAVNRLKTASAEVLGLGVGAAVFKPFESAIKLIKNKRDMAKQGFTNEHVEQMAGIKREIDENITLGDQLKSNVTQSANKQRTEEILTGQIDVSKKTRERKPSATALAKAQSESDELVKRVFGGEDVVIDEEKILKSTGFVDNPTVANVMKVASEKGEKSAISWTETEARALGMSLEDIQSKFGTAGEFTAAVRAASNRATGQAAKFVEQINKEGLDSADSINALADLFDSLDLAENLASEAGRATNILKSRRQAADALNALDAKTKSEMTAMAQALGKDPDKLMTFMRQAKDSKVSDLSAGLRYYWMNSLLSGPLTHLTNIVGNLSFLALRPIERGGAAAIGLLRNSDERAFFKEVMAQYQGIGDGFAEAIKILSGAEDVDNVLKSSIEKTTKLDDTVEGIAQGEAVMRKAIGAPEERMTMEQFKQLPPTAKGQELLARALSAPTDFLGSTDNFMKMMSARGEKRALAVRDSIEKGLTGDEYSANINRIMNNISNTPEEMAKLRSINESATYFAVENTFQKELGKVGNLFVKIREDVPMGWTVLPFVKTPVNIMDETFLRRTPLGIADGSIRRQILEGGAKGDEAIARMTIGTGIASSVVAGYASGMITGAGPSKKAERERWLETHQPWSIKVGDEWYQYNRIEPLGTIIGIGAQLGEIFENTSGTNELNQEDEESLVFASIAGMSKYVTDKSLMTGIDNALKLIQGEEGATKQLISSIAGGFVPFSGAGRQVATTVDPELREVETIFDRIRSGLPGLSEDLPNKRNRFGDVVTRSERTLGMILPVSHTPGGVKDEKTRQINEIEAESGIVIGRPSRIFKGVKLDWDQYDRRMKTLNELKIGGKTVKDAIIAFSKTPAYKMLPSTEKGGRGDIVKKIYRQYLNAADSKFLMENQDVNDKIKQSNLESFTIQRQLGETTGTPEVNPNRRPVFVGAQ